MSNKKSILIIDDSNSALMLMDWILKNEGYETYAYPGVVEGLEILKSIKPDLIILDLQMPNISGYDFLKMKKELKLEDVPVIIVSAIDTTSSIKATLELGANEFISKPLKPPLLLEMVKKYLR
jgi:DNA-binding response OmpR family regulator